MNQEDERSIQGVGHDSNKANELYTTKADGEEEGKQGSGDKEENKKNSLVNFHFMNDDDIKLEVGSKPDIEIDRVFGRKVSLGVLAIDWKLKESALKIMYKMTDKFLTTTDELEYSINEITCACMSAISLTCKEKVIKVFSISLQLLNLIVGSMRLEKTLSPDLLKNQIVERNVVLKLLQKSEEGNTRVTNKIHEALLDLSYNPMVGEALTSAFILQRVQAHNRAS